ncbi:MAG: PEGA domain-containing protein [Caldisericaceae bacterium]
MKKSLLAILLVVCFVFLAGCGVNQGETNIQKNSKTVKFDSVPQGAELFIDNDDVGKTPLKIDLTFGEHSFFLLKDGFENYYGTVKVIDDKKDQSVNITLNKIFLMYGEVIRFVDRPKISTSGYVFDPTYSGIYLNDKVDVSGYTVLDSFEIAFPSGSKVHFDTETTSYKDAGGQAIRKFSKDVAFSEIGEYRVMHNNEIVTPTVGGPAEYKFQVLYKAKVLNGTTLGSLNGKANDENKILLPCDETLDLRLLLTDANGNIAKNKMIGLGDLKTDNKGIVSIRISNNMGQSPFVVYGDVICWTCEYTTFDSNGNLAKSCFMEPDSKGNLVKSTPPNIPKKVDIVSEEDGHLYMPFDCSGLSLSDLGFKWKISVLLVHPKNPLVIYTPSSVSRDGGKTFENFYNGLSLHVIAIDPNNPAVIYGWMPQINSSQMSGLLRSNDYGKHFTKISDLKVVISIVVDPKNSKKIYVTTNEAILRSLNGGKTWDTFFTCSGIPWINPHNSDVILTTGCNFAGTTDGGKTWDNLNFFNDRPREWNEPVAFAFDAVKPNVVYGITYSHLFKSEDNGKSWTMPSSRYLFDLWSIATDPTNSEKVYLGCTDGVLASSDGGRTFTNLTNPSSYTEADFKTYLSVSPDGILYAVLSGIPFKLTNGRWLPLNGQFLDGGPDWKIVNGTFYVAVNTINSDKAAVKINYQTDMITFYKLYYMGP